MSAKKLSDYWINIFLLSLGTVMVNLWATHHFGNKWLSYLIPNVIILLFSLVSFFFKIFNKKEVEETSHLIRRFFYITLHPLFLTTFFILMLTVSSILSSVLVISNEAPKDELTISLISKDGGQTKSCGKLSKYMSSERFVIWTSPFGKPYSLEVDGYNIYHFNSYPWRSKKIVIERDLLPNPSILVRVPISKQLLLSKGRIIVKDNKDTLINETTNNLGSMFIGNPILQGDIKAFDVDWNLELDALGIDQKSKAQILIRWKNPKIVGNQRIFKKGNDIQIHFVSVNGDLLAKKNCIIGSSKIQDVLLTGIQE